MRILKELLKKLKDNRDIEFELLEAHVHPDIIERLKNLDDPLEYIKQNLRVEPLKGRVFLLVGVNGSGKTTTAVKLAKWFIKKGKEVVIAASDTFRAGSIEQLEEWQKRVPFRLIKKDYGWDPAAVAYEAVHTDADIVIIDTAGRQDTRKDLIDELRKIKTVSKPDKTIMVVDATQGVSVVEQVKRFDDGVGVDGFIVAKYDIDEQGGVPLTVGLYFNKPIYFVAMGQSEEDLAPFDVEEYLSKIYYK